ncbi:SBBP repeat-containing protein [Hymenobacter lucidus]|uniref:SBBP repeat-containing protein n=1 Tax=Hymenobacter lucidus TaxID=2880930 RepID=A0ABS8AS10_9BACT|nr:SBBP repeat-containing protein [Hymenobacter lucidus]MCB2408778.1 SBBP repeat-containing protein [Hymenobacter lucidus]
MSVSTLCCRFLLLACLTGSLSAQAQTGPAWTHATATGRGTEVRGAMVADAAGNTYEAGSFSGSLTLGTTQLTSIGNSDGYLAKYAPDGSLTWVRQIGSVGRERAYGVAVDGAGNAYITGSFGSALNLGNGISLAGPATSTVNDWLYVARYSAQGTPEWAQQASTGPTATSAGCAIGVDAQGSVSVAGTLTSSITIGSLSINTPPTTLNTGTFLARFSGPTGTLQALTPAFFYAAGHNQFKYQPRLAVGTTGETYLIDFFNQSIVLPDAAATTITSRGSNDEIILKYGPTSTFQWLEQIGGTGEDRANAAAVDAAGNLYVAGYLEGSATFGAATTVTGAGSWDGYLAKYSPQGVLQWAQPSGGTSFDAWNALGLDAAGNPYVAGYFAGTARFGSSTLTSAGSADMVVAAYSPTGQVRWLRQVGSGSGSATSHYLDLDKQGNIYVKGGFSGTVTVGPFSLTSTVAPPNYETFLARLGNATLATQASRSQPLGLYPNPASNQLHLPALPAGTRVQLLDALGRVARTAVVAAGATVSVQSLLPGLYTLRATDAQGQQFAGKVAVE